MNTDFHLVKSTLLAIAGRETVAPKGGSAPPGFKVAALIDTFNELDIIEEVVNHLSDQGMEVHVFDNWSNDGTWEKLVSLREQGRLANLARFPDSPVDQYLLKNQLENAVRYARTISADWILRNDADEIRSSPWRGVSIRDAAWQVQQCGYNAVDFTVIDFRFIEGVASGAPYKESLNFFEFGRRPGHFNQVKLSKNQQLVDLAQTGGHLVEFPNRRIYPLKFLLRHLPLRNKAQAESKVFKDRLPRFKQERSTLGWHTQYDRFQEGQLVKGWSRHGLIPWHPNFFATEYLTERLFGVGIREGD